MRRLLIPRYIHWSALSALSNSFAARATILIPLIGYLILFNEKMADYLNLVGALNAGDTQYGVSVRLISLYMGLCFVAAGVMVYAVRCPNVIKGFSTAPEFINGVQDTISSPSLRVIEVTVGSEASLQDEFAALRTVRVNEPVGTKDEYVRGLLFLYFGFLDESREYSRLLCLMLYALGFAFVSIPSLKIFVKVFGIFANIMLQGIKSLGS